MGIGFEVLADSMSVAYLCMFEIQEVVSNSSTMLQCAYSLHEGLSQLASHTELLRPQKMISPAAALSCKLISGRQAISLNKDAV